MKNLPLHIERQLTVRSLLDKTLKTSVKVLGARHGDLIMIEDPVCHVDERSSVSIEGAILCQLYHEGNVYRFQSRVRRALGEGMTVIDYPERFVAAAIRRRQRIQVNVKARLFLESTQETFVGRVLDISESGCFVVVPRLIHVTKDALCRLELSLPDRQHISGLVSQVRTMNFLALKKTTGLGLQFTGPPGEMSRISAYCDQCMPVRV